ncbi:MAG TPA: pentapeptide repeat-containing protein [Candidatus Paceibacterota bacterium]|nr:pentapeptide repeat-containing protein [Candidatus Paceibacterota bacterium]
MKKFKIISVVSLVLFFVLAVFGVAKFSSAHGGNTHLVHTCVLTLTGTMRSVGAGTNCLTGETALDFPKDFEEIPFACTNCPFTNARAFPWRSGNFADTILTESNFGGDFSMAGWNFTNAQLEYVQFYRMDDVQVNLTGANFTDATLQGAMGMGDTILTSVTWSNTICPDGTNSNSHSNTCAGHLTP